MQAINDDDNDEEATRRDATRSTISGQSDTLYPMVVAPRRSFKYSERKGEFNTETEKDGGRQRRDDGGGGEAIARRCKGK